MKHQYLGRHIICEPYVNLSDINRHKQVLENSKFKSKGMFSEFQYALRELTEIKLRIEENGYLSCISMDNKLISEDVFLLEIEHEREHKNGETIVIDKKEGSISSSFYDVSSNMMIHRTTINEIIENKEEVQEVVRKHKEETLKMASELIQKYGEKLEKKGFIERFFG